MAAPPRRAWTREDYARDAREYLERLPLEHFMEATPQAAQRAVTLASLELMRPRRPGFRCFNELLVHGPGREGAVRVVPDNMVVLDFAGEESLDSWPLGLAPCPPFWVLEYVSESSRRKDYVENFEKYEEILRVPYYLVFDPDDKSLSLYRHDGVRYAPAEANARRRLALPEVEMEVAVLSGWARFWHRGELLPLPLEREQQLAEMRGKFDDERAGRLLAEKQKEALQGQLDQAQRLNSASASALAAMVAALRPVVEARARQVGRQDVLGRLAATNDGEQLARWLAEMG